MAGVLDPGLCLVGMVGAYSDLAEAGFMLTQQGWVDDSTLLGGWFLPLGCAEGAGWWRTKCLIRKALWRR